MSPAQNHLDRARVIRGAVELADEIGVDALTMRRLADHLRVRPMSIYTYVSSKNDLVDGMVGQVFAEISRPAPDVPWKDAVRIRARSTRAVLHRHPWAIPLMESRRNPTASVLAHHDAALAVWLRAGFPLPLVAHANVTVDAVVSGCALRDAARPGRAAGNSFDFGLETLLDALERASERP